MNLRNSRLIISNTYYFVCAYYVQHKHTYFCLNSVRLFAMSPYHQILMFLKTKDYIPIRMAQSITLTMLNAENDVEQKELSFTACENVKQYSHFGRQFDNFL